MTTDVDAGILTSKILASGTVDEKLSSTTASTNNNTHKTVELTDEEKQARREAALVREEAARDALADDNSGNDRLWIAAAVRGVDEDSFNLGAGDDKFIFGNGGRNNVLDINMGEGGNDVVVLTGSIDDYAYAEDADGGITISNMKSGVTITFTGAETFTFQNKVSQGAYKIDSDDTSFSAAEMLAIANAGVGGSVGYDAVAAAETTAGFIDLFDPSVYGGNGDGGDGAFIDFVNNEIPTPTDDGLI